jgi:enoyl-CoA hydratase
MSYENILFESDGRVATITLNRPEKLNALSNELRGEMFHALKEAEADREIGVIIIKGAGRAFSAGYDLSPSRQAREGHAYVHPRSGMPDTGSTHPAHYDWSRHVLMANWQIWELSKPVIAQVHGYCLAGATELASFCDFRIVAEDAQVGYPPVRAMGTMDIMWAPWHLPMTKAREFAYVGDAFSGKDMAAMGWATYAVPGEELAEFTLRFARRMAHIDNHLLMYSKRSVNRQYEAMGIRGGLMSGTDVEAMSKHRPEAGEFGRISAEKGLKAALEWRDAPFRDFRGAYATAPTDRPLAGTEPREPHAPKNADGYS